MLIGYLLNNEWNSFCLVHEVEYLKPSKVKSWTDSDPCAKRPAYHIKAFMEKQSHVRKSFHRASLGVSWSSAAPPGTTARHDRLVDEQGHFEEVRSLGAPCSWDPWCTSSVSEEAEVTSSAQPKEKRVSWISWTMQELGKTTQLATMRFSGRKK